LGVRNTNTGGKHSHWDVSLFYVQGVFDKILDPFQVDGEDVQDIVVRGIVMPEATEDIEAPGRLSTLSPIVCRSIP
jgi:hypothetical protein